MDRSRSWNVAISSVSSFPPLPPFPFRSLRCTCPTLRNPSSAKHVNNSNPNLIIQQCTIKCMEMGSQRGDVGAAGQLLETSPMRQSRCFIRNHTGDDVAVVRSHDSTQLLLSSRSMATCISCQWSTTEFQNFSLQ